VCNSCHLTVWSVYWIDIFYEWLIRVTCIGVKHNEDCKESKQCYYSKETECRDSKCKCKTNFKYNGTQCLGSLGTYVHNAITVIITTTGIIRNIILILHIVIKWVSYVQCKTRKLAKTYTAFSRYSCYEVLNWGCVMTHFNLNLTSYELFWCTS
jgi:hypothetical protein